MHAEIFNGQMCVLDGLVLPRKLKYSQTSNYVFHAKQKMALHPGLAVGRYSNSLA